MPVIAEININNMINTLKNAKIPIAAAALTGKNAILPKNCALFIGNEASGLAKDTQKAADLLIKIPMKGKAESLNAAVAAAILMYKFSLNL